MRYLPATNTEIQEMLAAIGADSIDSLLHDSVPEALRLRGELGVGEPEAEGPLLRRLRGLAERNLVANGPGAFLGAGYYSHFSPAIVDQLLLRSEFYTAYTPYQPDVAQGTLQATWEFQTLICQLTGMDLANASLYEGGSAVAEALLMADSVARGKRRRAIVVGNLNPEYRAVADTYTQFGVLQIDDLPLDAAGLVDRSVLEQALDSDVCAVVVQYPAFRGEIEDLQPLADLAHAAGALLVVAVSDLYALAMLKPPGEMGADIVCGEGQAMGVPTSLGGPAVGIFATVKKHLRTMPGRLIGRTVDADGKPGFVLTLSTREQHIRRERATSNICTNQGLMAIAATIHMAAMGEAGLREAARQSNLKSRYLKGKLASTPNVVVGSTPTFHEFVVRTHRPATELLAALKAAGILGGVPLSRWGGALDELLVCVTEQNDREHLDRYARVAADFASQEA